jgi:hypothetical protein
VFDAKRHRIPERNTATKAVKITDNLEETAASFSLSEGWKGR